MSESGGDAGGGRAVTARPAVAQVSAARGVRDTHLAVFLRHPPLIAVVVATLLVALVCGNLNNIAIPQLLRERPHVPGHKVLVGQLVSTAPFVEGYVGKTLGMNVVQMWGTVLAMAIIIAVLALPLSRVANAWSKSNAARLGLAGLLALALLRDTERASV